MLNFLIYYLLTTFVVTLTLKKWSMIMSKFAVIETMSRVNNGTPFGMPTDFLSDSFVARRGSEIVLFDSERQAKAEYGKNLTVISRTTRLKKVSSVNILKTVVDFVHTLSAKGVINEGVVLASLLK